jgi:hypothetical protein
MEDRHLIVELGEVRIDEELYELDWWKGKRGARDVVLSTPD